MQIKDKKKEIRRQLPDFLTLYKHTSVAPFCSSSQPLCSAGVEQTAEFGCPDNLSRLPLPPGGAPSVGGPRTNDWLLHSRQFPRPLKCVHIRCYIVILRRFPFFIPWCFFSLFVRWPSQSIFCFMVFKTGSFSHCQLKMVIPFRQFGQKSNKIVHYQMFW